MGRGGFGAPMMGNHMGGMGGGMRGGRNFTNDLYADYNGPDGSVVANGMGGPVVPAANVEPSVQIIVRNVSTRSWSVPANTDVRPCDSCLGRPPTKILSSCLKPLAKSYSPKSCSKARGPRAAVSFSSRKSPRQRKLVKSLRVTYTVGGPWVSQGDAVDTRID